MGVSGLLFNLGTLFFVRTALGLIVLFVTLQ